MYVQKQKSKTLYARKHYGLSGELATRAIFVSSALLRGLVFGLLGVLRTTPDRKARLRLAGAVIRFHLLGREPTA